MVVEDIGDRHFDLHYAEAAGAKSKKLKGSTLDLSALYSLIASSTTKIHPLPPHQIGPPPRNPIQPPALHPIEPPAEVKFGAAALQRRLNLARRRRSNLVRRQRMNLCGGACNQRIESGEFGVASLQLLGFCPGGLRVMEIEMAVPNVLRNHLFPLGDSLSLEIPWN
ncbi:unnamed protein product [Cuscuta campestris]|uniref:Uncharacterized protein n=1 Tax=Cuscuta campestris TaxID=132261 RepID=A0A484LK30_9ASTE|nr:unnamed protein product [Cuscuta campestris]